MSRADQLRAELELVELEAALEAAKGESREKCDKCGQRLPVKRTAKAAAELRALKDKVREARRASREAEGR